MSNQFDYLSFIKMLLKFSPRQLEGETATAAYLVSFLSRRGVRCRKQHFTTVVPRIENEVLFADGRRIPCQGCGFVKGKIEGKDHLLSSLIPSRFFLEEANINFNPACPATISCSNFYFAPAVAIPRAYVANILRAERVRGEINVTPTKHRSINILVGNCDRPEVLCFAHYDSINKGAIDNASGVAVMLAAILKRPENLARALYVFSANEELSYDKPTYWGHGFRVFEEKLPELMRKARKIIVIDSLGNGPTELTDDPRLLYLAFPIRRMDALSKKVTIISGDFDHLMSVYHSDADDMRGLKVRYLEEATQKLLTLSW